MSLLTLINSSTALNNSKIHLKTQNQSKTKNIIELICTILGKVRGEEHRCKLHPSNVTNSHQNKPFFLSKSVSTKSFLAIIGIWLFSLSSLKPRTKK
jgi:hypothetical protein